MIQCRHGCKDEAVVRVFLSKGCIVFPDDKEQDLCWHHFSRLEDQGALGAYSIVKDYTLDKKFLKK